MANKIKINVEAAKEAKICKNTTYRFNRKSGVFTLYWKGKKTQTIKGVVEGEPMWIDADEHTSVARRLQLPKRKAGLLMWLLGFEKSSRRYKRDDFDMLYEKKIEDHNWDGVTSFVAEGHGWALSLVKKNNGGVAYAAAYITDSAASNKREVKEILNQWHIVLAKPFVEKILRNRFGFDDDDIKDIGINLDLAV